MIPEHYARDIVERCDSPIESLLPVVIDDSDQFGGPLGTTFLIAMSTPMILLPLERILKPADRDAVADKSMCRRGTWAGCDRRIERDGEIR